MDAKIVIYCDGACSGNPGPGGWGSLVAFDENVSELAGAEPATTNNRMEMTASLAALTFCTQLKNIKAAKQIQILTDSVYVIRGMTQWIFGWKKRGWKTAENNDVSNQDLWKELDTVIQKLKSLHPQIQIDWNFVKGHAGIPGNERCDQIAVALSKNDWVDLYKGPLKNYFFNPYDLPEIKNLPEMKKKTSGEATKAWYVSYVNGVFSQHQTWKECEALVKGRAAQFKKVTTQEEEEKIKKAWGVRT